MSKKNKPDREQEKPPAKTPNNKAERKTDRDIDSGKVAEELKRRTTRGGW